MRAWFILLLTCSQSFAAPSLMAQRQHALSTLEKSRAFCGMSVDARTDILAFPAGRSDALYEYSLGIGRAYRLEQGRMRLVWCGKALYIPAENRWASKLGGNAARALLYPFGTKWGRLPVETGGMDIFADFSGTLTTSTMNAAGKTVCSKSRGDPVAGEFRSIWTFDARDTCP